VFLDESGAKTNMTRLYGRSPKGKRCRCKAPYGRWERVTMLFFLRVAATTESIVFEGATDRAVFDRYIEGTLAPALKPGDILVLDNLNVHKSPAMLKAVEGRGASAMFLPAYSPDLNPIEKMWSKVKTVLRKMEPRTNEELFSAVGTALRMVTASDAKGWFDSCGYVATQS
jgi:transposase